MDADHVPLSDEVLAVMRAAVTYAVECGAPFVAPAHVLLALLDDAGLGAALRATLERGRVRAAARQPAPAGVVEVNDAQLPHGAAPPFARYDTLVFGSTDGRHQRWLTRETFKIFNESARRVEAGGFLPRHLVLGLAIEGQAAREIRPLLGGDPEAFRDLALALQ